VNWITAFVGEIQARTGRLPLIYTNADWWNTCTGGSAAFSADPLWVTSYGTNSPTLPAGWGTYAFWQYTSSGSAPGISTGTDVSYFNGDLNALAAFAGGGSAVAAFSMSPGMPRSRCRSQSMAACWRA